jgi:myo-inositol-1(or 4)-monophosphatase
MSRELETAVEAARRAGKLLVAHFGEKVRARRKTPDELVTSMDLRSEEIILALLRDRFPDYGVWSEESEPIAGRIACRWIVDPLDGTHNYYFHIPVFGISIALERDGEIDCGVVFLPVTEELYTAKRGEGAFLNGTPVRVSERKPQEAMINVCSSFLREDAIVEKIKTLKKEIFNIRSFGCAAYQLAGVAMGRLDAVIEFDEKPGDHAAGWLLVEEAGGRFTGLDGSPFTIGQPAYVASSGAFHEMLTRLLGR